MLEGVSGSVDVFAEAPGGRKANVTLLTAAPMNSPVRMATEKGNVVYQVGPGSTGRFDLRTDKGFAELFVRGNRVGTIRASGSSLTAGLGEVGNEVVLRSGEGRVRAKVIERPEDYRSVAW